MTALNGRWWYARKAAYTGKRIYLRSDLEEQQALNTGVFFLEKYLAFLKTAHAFLEPMQLS